MKRAQLRLAFAGTAFLFAAFAACKNDQLAGPYHQLGEPLLDISLGAAAAPAWPSGTVVRSNSSNALIVVLNNLMPLPPGTRYEVLLLDSASGNFFPAPGTLRTQTRSVRPVTRDSAVISTADSSVSSGVAVIAAADTNQTITLTISYNALPDPNTFSVTHVVVIATSSDVSAGTLDRNRRRGFLYARIPNAAVPPATSASRSLTFGSFALNSARRLPFAINGSYDGAFVGNTVRLSFRDLVRPPEGLQYATWLIDDRTGKSSRIGGLLTPVPDNKPLTEADTGSGRYLSADGVIESQARGVADSARGVVFDNFTRVVLLLEPKGPAGAVPATASAALVVSGSTPVSVSSRHATAGKISGTVTQNSAPVANATVYLTGATASPLVVANTDATGKFLFRTVNVGTYTVNVIPKGQTTVVASKSVTLGTLAGNRSAGDSIAVNIAIP